MIAKAAVRFQGKVYTGWRHHVILNNIRYKLGIRRVHAGPGGQGFMTDDGRYVDREEAGRIAIECGQVNPEQVHKRANHLFSEFMWDKNGNPEGRVW